MEIKTGNIISLDILDLGHSDHSMFYVHGIDNDKYFLSFVYYGGELNGKKHLVLRDEFRVSIYIKEEFRKI